MKLREFLVEKGLYDQATKNYNLHAGHPEDKMQFIFQVIMESERPDALIVLFPWDKTEEGSSFWSQHTFEFMIGQIGESIDKAKQEPEGNGTITVQAFLESKGLVEQAKANTEAAQLLGPGKWDLHKDSTHPKAITRMFIWDQTPEGDEFWKEVSKEFETLNTCTV